MTDDKLLKRIAVVGPVYPYKGGISHYTGLMVRSLQVSHSVDCVSYSLQYPKILFKKEQKEYGNKAFEIPEARFVINTANPFNWASAARQIREKDPQLVIIQWWHPYFAPCYQGLLRGLKGIPVFFVCHNVLPHERFPLDTVLTKGTLKAAAGCIVHSSLDEEGLKALLPRMPYRRNPHPSYNAFKLSGIGRDEARAQLGIGPEEKLLLFFGLVRKYKGLNVLIEAAPAIVKALGDVRIAVVGDFGKAKEEYMQSIEESGVKDSFLIRDGYVPDAGVEPWFAAADLCVCPYLSATQSGIVQIAFGFDLPVIATAVGGLPEAVTDGKTGYIVPPSDPAALADAIVRFFREDKAGGFADNVRAEADRFSWSRMTETIADLYGEVAG